MTRSWTKAVVVALLAAGLGVVDNLRDAIGLAIAVVLTIVLMDAR